MLAAPDDESDTAAGVPAVRTALVPTELAVVLGLCCAVDAADGVLLPTLFRALEQDLGLTSRRR